MSTAPKRRVRVLVVDDSVVNRRAITTRLTASGEVEVVGRAADGNEALRLAYDLKPDVITLDLEMPKMDGFSFLRLLMASRPSPVIVVSSYGQKENVFRALELGAVDFVAKPDASLGSDADDALDGLLQKVLLFREGTRDRVNVRPSHMPPSDRHRDVPQFEAPRLAPRVLVAIVASTGGPSALSELFAQLSSRGSYAVLIAQHMPERFTRTFAERLNRKSVLDVREAQDGDVVVSHSAFVCPGRQCMEVELAAGGQLRVRVVAPTPEDRYAPSGNRLLTSVAKAARTRAIGVVLTGMGDDGTDGARAIREAGGIVIAESEETAVIFGMPGQAARAGVVTRALPLYQIADFLDELVR
ncbi:MAG TPA: chemotaxis-specific protein-glutamate methyltransferase CheB [Polyangiaceae bacterium]|jgi:two-component system chemotaxis response regulator CheB|nr:chemotaxis-specific protein-glutamate methyltransferase CheB [Polyangiaceae bacterium]